MPLDTEDLKFELDERVATLTMNRPDKLNALSSAMIESAIGHLERCATDPDVGAVVLTGAGRGFCAGGDIEAMASAGNPTLEEAIDVQKRVHRFSWLLYELPKVTIAAINGAAAGAGLGLALSCDLRIATKRAKLLTAFAKVGFGGDFGTTWNLARLVGPAKAKELFFLSDAVLGEEAVQLGLVNRAVEGDAFSDEVATMARRIAHGPLVSYRYMKENVNLAMTADCRTLLDREALTHLRCGQTDDHREGVAAFLEKRAPAFRGR